MIVKAHSQVVDLTHVPAVTVAEQKIGKFPFSATMQLSARASCVKPTSCE